jgi:hypothetical protein
MALLALHSSEIIISFFCQVQEQFGYEIKDVEVLKLSCRSFWNLRCY